MSDAGPSHATRRLNADDAARGRNLILIDDDATLCEAMARAFTARGFAVRIASTGEQAARLIDESVPDYAIIDLKLPDSYGLKLISALMARDRSIRIVMLTGYGSLATAIEAIKLGAIYYLAKPSNIDAIIEAFQRDAGNDDVPVSNKTMSLSRLEWEHIQRVLSHYRGNISATARALSMHRRTLQRKIGKHPMRS
jgi:two-component system response regulator RegA